MSLTLAIDELYATGWSARDSSGCVYEDGRAYPSPKRVAQEFQRAGVDLNIENVDRYSCYRAKWAGVDPEQAGVVVAPSEAEVAVFALAQHRRQATVALGV